MGKPDALSRRADHNNGRLDNRGQILLSPDLFRVRALAVVRAEGEGKDMLREV